MHMRRATKFTAGQRSPVALDFILSLDVFDLSTWVSFSCRLVVFPSSVQSSTISSPFTVKRNNLCSDHVGDWNDRAKELARLLHSHLSTRQNSSNPCTPPLLTTLPSFLCQSSNGGQPRGMLHLSGNLRTRFEGFFRLQWWCVESTVAVLECFCKFHKACIDSWFLIRRTCPNHGQFKAPPFPPVLLPKARSP